MNDTIEDYDDVFRRIIRAKMDERRFGKCPAMLIAQANLNLAAGNESEACRLAHEILEIVKSYRVNHERMERAVEEAKWILITREEGFVADI